MRNRWHIRRLWTAGMARARDERGVAMAEYIPLLAVISLVVFFSFSYAGPWVYDQLIDASIPLFGDSGCPAGQYQLTLDPDPANGVDRDLNGDSWYCSKEEADPGTDLPGNGNNGNNADIKDNNRPAP